MDCGKSKAFRKTQFMQDPGLPLPGPLQVLEKDVVHDIADEVNAAEDPFLPQVGDGCVSRAERNCAEVIADYSVHFFGHSAVEASQTSFDVSEGQMELRRDKAASHSRVGVAVHENPVRTL